MTYIKEIENKFVNDAAAEAVLIFLKREKWRQARDRVKELCKKDRLDYLLL